MRKGLRAGSILPVLLLSGCITSADYPKDWAATVKGGCDAVAGIYRNAGDRQSDDWPIGERRTPTFLSQYLVDPLIDPIASSALEKAERVEITYAADKLTARIGSATAEFSVAAGNLKCTPQGAVIDIHSGSLTPNEKPIAMGYSHTYQTLMRTADGSLAVRSVNSGVGIVFFFWPVAGSSSSWAHFTSVPATP